MTLQKCSLTFLVIALVSLGRPDSSTAQAMSVPDLVRRISPAVVTLRVYDASGEAAGLGSGFLIANGRVITNAHVVEGSSRVEVVDAENRLMGVVAYAEVLSTSADLAVLPAVSNFSTTLRLADQEPAVGTRIFVFGSPQGFRNTISDGLVSGYRDFGRSRRMQITAPIAPGSSGGPVIDGDGQVVGISVSIWENGQNLNFAVPLAEVRAVVNSPAGRYPLAGSSLTSEVAPANTASAADNIVTLTVGESARGELEAGDLERDGRLLDLYRFDGSQGDNISVTVGASLDTKAFIFYYDEGEEFRVLATDDDSGPEYNPLIDAVLPVAGTYLLAVEAYDADSTGTYSLRLSEGEEAQILPSVSSRWIKVYTDDEFTLSIDRESIRKTGSIVSGWVLYQYFEEQHESWASYDTNSTLYRVDCSRRMIQGIEDTYRLSGRLTYSSDSPYDWNNVGPETVGEEFAEAMCVLAGVEF